MALAGRRPLEHSPGMETLRLFGTPLSHFTRKVRIVLAELGVAYEYVRTGSVLAPTRAGYGENPLLRVPTLVRGDVRDAQALDALFARFCIGK